MSGGRHSVHADGERILRDQVAFQAAHEPPAVDVPVLVVDTTAGYEPGLDAIVCWARDATGAGS